MKRNNDLIRDLLLEYEADEDWLIMTEGDTSSASQAEREIGYHQNLMADDGLLTYVSSSALRITSYGHDYLDAIRSDNVWNKTKSGAAKVGGMTLGMMKDLAVAYLKQEAAEKLGVTL
jgi:hypothetical protein